MTVAFVLGVAIGAIPVFVGKLSLAHPLFAAMSLPEQMKEYSLGLIPLTSLVYFVSLTAFLLYLNGFFALIDLLDKGGWLGIARSTKGSLGG